MHLKTLLKIFKLLDSLLDSSEFILANRSDEKAFTRKRTLDFKTIFYCVCSSQKRALQTEIPSFLLRSNGRVPAFSPQAFSKARYKIKSDAFYQVFRKALKLYCQHKHFHTRFGYRIFAIDGTTLLLPATKNNQQTFGTGGNQYKPDTLADASIFYDVLNDIVLDGSIDRYNTSERKVCCDLLSRTGEEFTGKKKLLLLDRGYPSRKLYHFLQEQGYKYVIRIPNAYCTPKALREAKSKDSVVTDERDNTLTHRLIQIPLTSGETELLVTNLFDKQVTWNDFYELYHLRWGIETKYSEVKHKYQLEKFTGYHPEGIRQDFFALLFLSNLSSLLKHESETQNVKKEHTKWLYQINATTVVNLLRENITQLFYEWRFRKKRLLQMVAAVKNKRSPLRPGRSFERKKTRTVKRYKLNHK